MYAVRAIAVTGMKITENGMSTNSKFENSLIAMGLRVMRTKSIVSLSKWPLFKEIIDCCLHSLGEWNWIVRENLAVSGKSRVGLSGKSLVEFQISHGQTLSARWKQMIIQFVVNSRAKQMLSIIVPSKAKPHHFNELWIWKTVCFQPIPTLYKRKRILCELENWINISCIRSRE